MFIFGLSLSATAAYYSIVGLIAIFSAAPVAVAIMGSILEVSKLTIACWLYRNITSAPKFLVGYFSLALVVLMLITSMGIYGYLSKARLQQDLLVTNTAVEIQLAQNNITSEELIISNANKNMQQLDSIIEKFVEVGAVSKAVNAKEEQQELRDKLTSDIEDSQNKIKEYRDQIININSEISNLESEIGPVKYIASLFVDDVNKDVIDTTMRGIILMLVFVFDPLAVLLIVAADREASNPRSYSIGVSPPRTRKPRKKKEVIPEINSSERDKKIHKHVEHSKESADFESF
jgi:ElaB/YqjD/DUF883 family membrane-anchored ribosome-binding protein